MKIKKNAENLKNIFIDFIRFSFQFLIHVISFLVKFYINKGYTIIYIYIKSFFRFFFNRINQY
jgi:hypothetical protein